MKRLIRKTLALGLALTLGLGQAAQASEALGHDLHTVTVPLSQGVTVTRGHFWSDTYFDLRTERYMTYTPGETVKPRVVYGSSLLERQTLTDMARSLESRGERVVGGVNGDFYVLVTGQPLGLVVTDEVVRSSSSYHYAVGFREDGTAFVGQPGLTASVVLYGDQRLTVFGGINKVREIRSASGGGLTLLTPDFGATTQNTQPGVDIVLRPMETGLEGETVEKEKTGLPTDLTVGQKLTIGGRVHCMVEEVRESQGDSPIPRDRLVLTMNGQDDPGTLNMLRSLSVGDEADLDLYTQDPRWGECTEALGGMYLLLQDGQLGENLGKEQTARTAIGVRPDGSVLFYTMDGKQPGYSVGASCEQVAKRLLELGCVDALGLDGGGSTTLGLTLPDEESMQVVNRPSDGGQRANSVGVFLTTRLEGTGRPSFLWVEPTDSLALAGAELSLSAEVVDTGYRTLYAANGAVYTVEGGGSVRGSLYTAGTEPGTDLITAAQGDLTGHSVVTVVKTPDKINLYEDGTGRTVQTLALDPGEQIDLTASAWWRNLSLVSADGNYQWDCDPEVGAVDGQGRFLAGERTAEGVLTVTAGERTRTIPVYVTGHILLLADMEQGNAFVGEEGIEAGVETDLLHVKVGSMSQRVEYAIGEETGWADLRTSLAIPEGEKYVGLWVWGDGSANSLLAVFQGPEGIAPVAVCGLGFEGWRHFLIPIPQGMTGLGRLRVVYGGESREGVFWLDQLTTSNEAVEDFTPPTVGLTVENHRATAVISDNVDRGFEAKQVEIFFDGKPISGNWSRVKSQLTATLPQAEPGTHRVTVMASDISGNLGRASYDLVIEPEQPEEPILIEGEEPPVQEEEEEKPVFVDTAGHWAESYALYLYEQGVTQGSLAGEERYFLPGAYITRAEFFTMVARWMGLDLSQYEDYPLPFGDEEEIPAWARSALAAMYDEGIVKGSLDNGTLRSNPLAGINRAEVMTILGRTQPRGWPEAELEGFADSDQVPSWAALYVRSLVGQKVVGGYADNTLRPLDPMTRAEVAKVLTVLR